MQPGDAIVGPQSGSNNDISQNQHDGDSSRSDSAARMHEQGKRTYAQAFNARCELNCSAPCCQMLNSSIRYQTYLARLRRDDEDQSRDKPDRPSIKRKRAEGIPVKRTRKPKASDNTEAIYAIQRLREAKLQPIMPRARTDLLPSAFPLQFSDASRDFSTETRPI